MIVLILVAVYAALGYWSIGKTIWANKVIIGNNIFIQQLTLGVVLGWILIPVAIIKCIFFRG